MKYWLAAFITIVALFAPGTASAAAPTTGLHLTTSPLPIHLTTLPGGVVSTELRVKNISSGTEQLKMGLMKFGAVGETGQPNLFERAPGDTYFDWVKFSPSVFSAPTNQWIDVKMTISVPKTAGLGYYYAVTFQRANGQGDKTARPGTSVVGATATMVLLEVKSPNEHRQLEIADFISDHRLYSYVPVEFQVRVRNTGNIFLAPIGNIFIKRGNTTIGNIAVNTAGGNVLPNSYRAFKVSWSDGFPVYVDKLQGDKPVLNKKGLPVRSLHWDLSKANKLRFGKYTAEALLVYNDGKHDIPMQASVSFWVVPWGLVGGLLLALLLVGAGVWTVGRSSWRRVQQTRSQSREV